MITKRNVELLRTELSPELEQKILNDLTVAPEGSIEYKPEDGSDAFPVYRVNATKYFVPIFYAKTLPIIPPTDTRRVTSDLDFDFHGTLRTFQQHFCQEVIDTLHKDTSCIACSPTGSGKTTMALNIISRMNFKTLIIVHKEFLMDQWKERIKTFLPQCTIGTIRQSTIDIQHPITIALIQSVCMHTYPQGTFDSFDFCIIDEVHHVGSKMFSRLFYTVGAKYKLGLSATPDRKDGLTRVLNWFLGRTLVNTISTDIDTPTVQFLNMTHNPNIRPKFDYKGRMMIPDLENQLSEDLNRTKQIVDRIKELFEDGRKILVLSSRREHCIQMKNMLQSVTDSIGLYMGQMKEKELTKSNECRIILGTYNMANEGYDNPTLDTLVLAMSKRDVEQSCGRILRQRNTHSPLIIDVVDTVMMSQASARKRWYYAKSFNVPRTIVPTRTFGRVIDLTEVEAENEFD